MNGDVRYGIDEPTAELTEGYFVLGLKYVTLFIVGWLASWVFVLFISARRRSSGSGLAGVLLDHAEITSAVLALGVVLFFGWRAMKKYKLGLLTSIAFDEGNGKVSLCLLNTINGKQVFKTIAYRDFLVLPWTRNHYLFGKQRVFDLFENDVLVNSVNVELTAWCRHEHIEAICSRMASFKRTAGSPRTEDPA